LYKKNLKSDLKKFQAQKMDSVELNGSHVARAWTVFIDETEKMVKYIKENAEFLANNTIDKINSL